jgi:hypothetical protein
MKMKYIKGSKIMNHILIGMAIVIFLTLIQIKSPGYAEESITTYCYRDNTSVGSIEVFDTSTAAGACNKVYYDCKGKCIGCFHDFDYADYVCVDTSGRIFLR